MRVASDPKLAPAEACLILGELEQQCEAGIKAESAKHQAVSLLTRWLYSESRLVHSLIQLRHPKIVQHVKQWEESVMWLDMAIIISGAPGDGRLDLILDTIDRIQSTHLPPKEDSLIKSGLKAIRPSTHALNSHEWAPTGIPHIVPPSASGFRAASNSPFILSGFLRNWPALTDHDWSSPSYLLQVAGQGRVVPVEIGSDYREEDWSQKLMSWEAFLQNIGILPSDEHNKNNDSSEPQPRSILYLAQHNLFTQFPKLRSDIIVPDYVYSSPQAPSFFPAYKPPGNEEQLVINAWLGPRGTISPAHTVNENIKSVSFSLPHFYSRTPTLTVTVRIYLIIHSSTYQIKRSSRGKKDCVACSPLPKRDVSLLRPRSSAFDACRS